MRSDEHLHKSVLEGFSEGLQRFRLSPRAQQFCRKWVADFLAFAAARHWREYELSHISLFLEQMRKAGRTGFQIDQARWSVMLFLRGIADPAGPVRQDKLPPAPEGSRPDELAGKETSALIARLEDEACLRHLSPKTLRAYRYWIASYLRRNQPSLAASFEPSQVRDFLVDIAHSGVSASTQNQVFSALRFLFVSVLHLEFKGFDETPRAPGRVRFPEALTREEAAGLLRGMREPWRLVAQVLYGCGLRLQEALSLRVQDLDFQAGLIRTYNGKGSRSRAVPLPRKLVGILEAHLGEVRSAFEADLQGGFAGAFLPDGLERKFPAAALEWPWQWVFPAQRLTSSLADGKMRRFHLHETGLQKEIKRAAKGAGLTKRVSPHILRHSFATEMLRMGYDIRTVQDLLGHADVATTMIYTHVLAASSGRVLSPLDI
jgi:integron integrase